MSRGIHYYTWVPQLVMLQLSTVSNATAPRAVLWCSNIGSIEGRDSKTDVRQTRKI